MGVNGVERTNLWRSESEDLRFPIFFSEGEGSVPRLKRLYARALR
jgi:hypothetical protein